MGQLQMRMSHAMTCITYLPLSDDSKLFVASGVSPRLIIGLGECSSVDVVGSVDTMWSPSLET